MFVRHSIFRDATKILSSELMKELPLSEIINEGAPLLFINLVKSQDPAFKSHSTHYFGSTEGELQNLRVNL